MKSLYGKNIALTNKSAIGFGNIHSFCSMTIFFDGCSSFGHLVGNLQKNKHVDPIFLLQNFNLLFMAVNWAKFEKNWIVHPFEASYLYLL